MLQKLREFAAPSSGGSIAPAFARLGWIGFWLQIILGSVPIALMIYVFVFARSGSGPRNGLPLVEHLTVISLLMLAFTTLWSYRYTRLAKQIEDPQRRPTKLAVHRTVWIGVTASTLSIVFSMLVMLIEVANILIYFLKAPQAGIPAIQATTTGGQTSWVSAIDIMSLMALNLTLFAELIVLILSLWLLFRTTVASATQLAQASIEDPGLDDPTRL